MERVVLLSVNEEIRSLVDDLKREFEEKYHTCTAFREELLSGPEDSQGVAQNLQEERTLVIVVLNHTLQEILDHRKSRRLLNKIRDHFKAERVLFLKHQITEEEIRDFVADITDDETCELHSLSLKNISHITTQIWDLSSVNHKATESDEINGAMLSQIGHSLERAADKLNSSQWNAVDKESICGEDFTRITSDSSSDPQESHNSFTESMKLFDSSDTGSLTSSSSGRDGTVKLARDFPSPENIHSMTGKLSAKLQVDLSREDKENAKFLGKTDILHKNEPTSSLQQAAATGCCQKRQSLQCSAAKDDNKSIPCSTHQRLKQQHFVTTQSGDDWNASTQQTLLPVVGSPIQNVLIVRGSPMQEDSGLKEEERKCLQETTPNQHGSSKFPSQMPNLSNVQSYSQSMSNSNGRYDDSEHYERSSELGYQQSYATSYQQAYCSTPIRCQKCNHIKDHVKLYSIVPHHTGLASPTSIPNCFSIPNSSGPEAMTFSYSLCLDCSNNMSSTDSPIRQNFFCGTNETFQSSNLFPPAFEHVVSPSIVTQHVHPMYLSNFEKGPNPHQQGDVAMPRHQSSPSRLNHLNSHSTNTTNNFGRQEFRDEILDIDNKMRRGPPFQRNIPVNSAGSQQSNIDNTRIRSARTCPGTLYNIPESSQTTQSKTLPSHLSIFRFPERHSHDGASSELPPKPSNRISGDDSAAGASAASNGYDYLPLMSLSHVVIEYVQSQLDYTGSNTLNWMQLAHLHHWNFSMIDTIKKKWQMRVIESPFLELIQNSEDFQNYTYGQLKLDLEKIPRKDILEKLREFEEKEKLVV